jgi:hypothetical protein
MAMRFPTSPSARWAILAGVAGAALLTAGAATQVAAQPAPQGLGAKVAAIDHVDQVRVAAQAAPRPAKAANPQPPVTAPDPAWLTGILDHTGTPPVSGSQFQSTNAWFGLLNGQRLIVFAGSSAADPMQGAVVVWEIDQAPRTYLTPTRAGTVRITAASGDRLTLTASRGTSLVFDAATGQFA